MVDKRHFASFDPPCIGKRVTIFCGHYGSGKTNAAVSYALALAARGLPVVAYDLDVVNPYFRTKDAASLLAGSGVELVSSPYANTNVDVPAMPAAFYRMIDDTRAFAVVDVGGDDRGALALGRFAKGVLAENNYSFLFVLNRFRPETRTLSGALQIKREIETACGLSFTGVVNNPNVGAETTEKDVFSSRAFIEDFSKASGLKVAFTCVLGGLYEKLSTRRSEYLPILPIRCGEWA